MNFDLEFLEDRKIEIAIDLGRNNLKYICEHINSKCEIYTAEGSKEFAEEFNKNPKNRLREIKLLNVKPHIREFPRNYADLIVVKNVDFNTKEIFRVLKKEGIVIIYFPILSSFGEKEYLNRVEKFLKDVGFEYTHLFKNQQVEDGEFNILVGMK